MTTPAETAAALEASIQHWTDNIAAETPEDVSLDRDTCALCNLFWHKDCYKCPVSNYADQMYCKGTPFWTANAAFYRWTDSPDVPEARANWITAATAERDFLVSLRKDAK